MQKIISLDEAKKIINANITPIQRTEILKIKDIVKFNEPTNRVLARDVIASINLPPFDRAAMDGYAVKFEDTQNASLENPVELNLKRSVFPGKNKNIIQEIKSGECVYVTTGSVLPFNANAVVMIEDTKRNGNKVKIFKPVKLFENIGREGEDIKKGTVVLRNRDILTPAKIGVLAGIGIKNIEVYSIPRAAIISTGNEIVDVGKNLMPGKIYDINSYTLGSIIKKAGCISVSHKIVRDKENVLQKQLREALQYDVVIFSGGSSVGEKDLLRKVIESNGKILFHGVNVKPGKPILFGNVNGKPVFGMPGNPTSCLLSAYIFLLPALRKIAHLPFERKIVKAKMAEEYISRSDRHLFVTVKVEKGYAKIVYKTSGAITSMSEADGFIEIPINKKVIEKNEEVEVNLFEMS